MRTETRIFGLLAGLLLLAAAVYAWGTRATFGRVEFAGVTALGMSAVLAGMCGSYCWLVSRRIAARPEDLGDAQVSDGAGTVGFFAPASFWPLGIAIAVGCAGVGVAVGQWWLVAAGVIALLLAAAGLAFEFYTGTRRTE